VDHRVYREPFHKSLHQSGAVVVSINSVYHPSVLKLYAACSRPADRGWRWAQGGILHGHHSKSPPLNREGTCQDIFIDVPPLCRGGGDCASLEPSFRSHWSQARSLVMPRGYHHLDNPVRPLPFFLGHRLEVISFSRRRLGRQKKNTVC
jgi:hypothetical protein